MDLALTILCTAPHWYVYPSPSLSLPLPLPLPLFLSTIISAIQRADPICATHSVVERVQRRDGAVRTQLHHHGHHQQDLESNTAGQNRSHPNRTGQNTMLCPTHLPLSTISIVDSRGKENTVELNTIGSALQHSAMSCKRTQEIRLLIVKMATCLFTL